MKKRGALMFVLVFALVPALFRDGRRSRCARAVSNLLSNVLTKKS